MPDHVHPLVRDRKILAEAFDQLRQVADFYRDADRDPRPFDAEVKRLHLRLIMKQAQIEEADID